MELILPPMLSHPQWRKTGKFQWSWYESGEKKTLSMGYDDAMLELHNFLPSYNLDSLINRVMNFKRIFLNKKTGEVFSAPKESDFRRPW